ncbi:hypothetical protein GCM10023093_13220 [Nemorincola caseinilytica]|uniref:DUF4340 domain-containing protein n=1 Tax=Nemorincola caseinilytica TaxID=2054315 RepID=A0ABP8NC04_9BACT
MNKTILYLAILAVLGAGVYFLLRKDSNENPYDAREADFTIKDTGAIGRIFITDVGGESVLVERTDSGWMVNRQYRALPSTLSMLLATLTKQVPLYPVTKSAHDNVIKLMSTHGIKTEIYDRAGKKLKVFYVGGGAADGKGTNMLMENGSQPYVVETPGFVGYLTPRYSYRLRDWRDRTVFNVPASQIRSVSVTYAGKPQESFTVVQEDNDSVQVTTTSPAAKKTPLNTRRAHSYLRFFTNINCEGYLNGLEDNDTTFKTAPKHSAIELTLRNGSTQHVDIYWMALNRRSKNRKASDMPDEVHEEYDSDRMYAVMNNYRDTIMIQQLSFQNIFRRAHEFYTADAPPPPPAQGVTGTRP